MSHVTHPDLLTYLTHDPLTSLSALIMRIGLHIVNDSRPFRNTIAPTRTSVTNPTYATVSQAAAEAASCFQSSSWAALSVRLSSCRARQFPQSSGHAEFIVGWTALPVGSRPRPSLPRIGTIVDTHDIHSLQSLLLLRPAYHVPVDYW